jgi:hypothetical protein
LGIKGGDADWFLVRKSTEGRGQKDGNGELSVLFFPGENSSRVLVISWRNPSGAFGGHLVHTILIIKVKLSQD